jgi:hypothetical protein
MGLRFCPLESRRSDEATADNGLWADDCNAHDALLVYLYEYCRSGWLLKSSKSQMKFIES